MRIIGGQWRSRKIERPATDETRPMPDRVREAVFSMLGDYFDTPGSLPPIRVADAFAGSGSMGLEALSRGAASCRFFESGRPALTVLRENLIRFGLDADFMIDVRNAWLAAARCGPDADFDLVLLDPPYRDTLDTGEKGQVSRFLDRVGRCYDHAVTVMLHHPRDLTYFMPQAGSWRVVTNRTIGSNGITVFAS
jgi:16S rRNA (guanine(966)-N(2))-methyltransferase RsmD